MDGSTLKYLWDGNAYLRSNTDPMLKGGLNIFHVFVCNTFLISYGQYDMSSTDLLPNSRLYG